MDQLLSFLARNKEWLFSGLGLTVGTLAFLVGRAAIQALRGRRPPDLRVKPMPAISHHPLLGTDSFFTITVQNHSSFAAFISGFFIELPGRQKLMVEKDGMTGAFQGKQTLPPGDALTFHIPAQHLRSYLAEAGHSRADFRRAFVVDAVGRRYYSSRKECRTAITGALA